MSLIVGVVYKDQVWMGSDSYLEHNQTSFTLKRPKIVRKHEPESKRSVLLGVVGDAMLFDIAERCEMMDRPEGADIYKHVCNGIAQPLIETIHARGNALRLTGKNWPSGRFMIGYEGRIFIIDRQFYVVETTDADNAIGAGEDSARGALYAVAKGAPKKRIEMALQAGQKFSSYVCGPFHIEKL